jgi:hypothetical protein
LERYRRNGSQRSRQRFGPLVLRRADNHAVSVAGAARVQARGTAARSDAQVPGIFSELVAATPEVRRFSVQVGVNLSLEFPAGVVHSTGWINLPAIPVVTPTIPIPTILVLCEHANFAGRKLILVPGNSLLGAVAGSGAINIGAAIRLMTSAVDGLAVLGAPARAILGFFAADRSTPIGIAASVLETAAPAAGDEQRPMHVCLQRQSSRASPASRASADSPARGMATVQPKR